MNTRTGWEENSSKTAVKTLALSLHSDSQFISQTSIHVNISGMKLNKEAFSLYKFLKTFVDSALENEFTNPALV